MFDGEAGSGVRKGCWKEYITGMLDCVFTGMLHWCLKGMLDLVLEREAGLSV